MICSTGTSCLWFFFSSICLKRNLEEEKNPKKDHRRIRTLAELKEKRPHIFFLLLHSSKHQNPLLQIHVQARLKTQIYTHTLNRLVVSYSSSIASLIQLHCWLPHMAFISEPGCKSHGKIIPFHTAENTPSLSPKTDCFFFVFFGGVYFSIFFSRI